MANVVSLGRWPQLSPRVSRVVEPDMCLPVEAVGIGSSTTITFEEVVRDVEQTGTQNMNDDEHDAWQLHRH